MIITFNDEKAKMHFEFIYDGFIIGGSIVTEKGLTKLRRELGILDKLESISDVYPCGKKVLGDEPKRKLIDDNTCNYQIHIDEHEFDLLFHYISIVPWSTGKSSRDAVDTLDWLTRIQRGV